MKRIRDGLARIVNGIDKIERFLITVIFTEVIIVGVAQVVCRFVLRASLPWSEELLRFSFIWLTYTASSMGIMAGTHANVTVLIERFPAKTQKAMQVFIDLLTVFFCAVVFYFSNNTDGWTNAAMLNMAKCLELALHNGVEPFSGLQIGPKSGMPEELVSFEQVVAAYDQQIAYFVKQMVVMLNTWDQMHAELLPTPYMSTLIDGCLEKGTDVSRGGAVYNFIGVQGVGLSNVVDSLMALKKVVYEDHELSLREMVDILDRNFENDEYFRAKLVNRVPKFGNNIDEVDKLAQRVADAYCKEVAKYQCIRGGAYRPGLFPVASHVPLGTVVGALPSGRLSGTPLNDGISPVSGCDTHGPTMVLLSVSRVNHEEATNGTLLNMKVHPTALKTDEDMEKLCKLLRSFMDLKLMHIQFNVVSREQLLEAQRDPENHRDLIVRVAGYWLWSQI